MAMHHPKSGPNDVSAYILPGIPWVTGVLTPAAPAVIHLTFPAVTKFICVKNTSAAASIVRVGFTENGVLGNPTSNAHYFTLSQNQEKTLEVRIKDIYLRTESGAPNAELVAGLSHVLYSDFPVLTGSISGSGNVSILSGIG